MVDFYELDITCNKQIFPNPKNVTMLRYVTWRNKREPQQVKHLWWMRAFGFVLFN